MIKKSLAAIGFTAISGLVATPLIAGGIINKQNMSADYFRTLNRQAATDYADITVYNPAGIMEMKTGEYVKFDLQFISKAYANSILSVGRMEQNENSLLPGFYAIHKEDKWAGYVAASIVGGGGKIDYGTGNARSVTLISSLLGVPFSVAGTFPQRVQAESLYTGYTIGSAYSANNILSLSAGLRYVTAFKKYTLSAEGLPLSGDVVTELRDEASGWGGVFGVNIAPDNRWNIGLRFETATELDFDLEVRQGAALLALMGYDNGRKQREDLPALLGMGLSYNVSDDFKLDANFIYFLEKSAVWHTGFDGAGDSYDVGFTAEYRFNSDWMASTGYLYSNNKLEVEQLLVLPEEPKLDAHTIAIGGVWSPTETLDFSLGAIKVFYDDTTDLHGVYYDKDVWGLSCGVQWKFM